MKTDDYQAHARNKLIAEAFYLTGDIEKYGSGYIRVRKELAKYPTMQFKYEEMGNGFLVSLSYEEQKTQQKTPQKTKDKILILMQEENTITINEISKKIDISVDTVKEHISKLKNENRLQRVGGRKEGTWKVLQKRSDEE